MKGPNYKFDNLGKWWENISGKGKNLMANEEPTWKVDSLSEHVS